jgi:hypothetical protein
MQRGSQSKISYVLVGTAAICALGYARYFPETSDNYFPTNRCTFQIPHRNMPWDASYGIDIPTSQAERDEHLSVITQFAEKLVSETTDLDQDIVKALGQNFWDLI